MSTSPAPAPALSAAEITKASQSNLALAFFSLPPERRADISIFYAFCRVIDDLADEPGPTPEERRRGFEAWRAALRAPQAAEPPLAATVREIMGKYRLPVELFEEIIAGCEMDVARTVYQTWEELRLYCYRVASTVGLISIEIFGYRDAACRAYAVDLGLALQVTNIIRDVGEDWKNGGRIYLPREEMARFGYTIEDLAAGAETPALQALLEFQARRAEDFYARAVAALPPGDRKAMVAAEIMRSVYTRLLGKIRAGGYQVLSKRYRLSKLAKLWCIARVLWLGGR